MSYSQFQFYSGITNGAFGIAALILALSNICKQIMPANIMKQNVVKVPGDHCHPFASYPVILNIFVWLAIGYP